MSKQEALKQLTELSKALKVEGILANPPEVAMKSGLAHLSSEGLLIADELMRRKLPLPEIIND